jgi:hypothetical protein
MSLRRSKKTRRIETDGSNHFWSVLVVLTYWVKTKYYKSTGFISCLVANNGRFIEVSILICLSLLNRMQGKVTT